MFLEFLALFIVIVIVFFVFVKERNTYFSSLNNRDVCRNTLDTNGNIIIENVFTRDEINYIKEIIKNATDLDLYGMINSPINREDKVLLLDDMREVFKMLYLKNPSFWDTIFPNYKIVECSLLTSYPGAETQIYHSDSSYEKHEAELVSIGIALDDISEDMGPLVVIPSTNTPYFYENDLFINEILELTSEIVTLYNFIIQIYFMFFGIMPIKCVCSKGSLVFWSSKVIHRGSENISNKKRSVLYFSLLEPNKKTPYGPTYSLSSQDKDKNISLSNYTVGKYSQSK